MTKMTHKKRNTEKWDKSVAVRMTKKKADFIDAYKKTLCSVSNACEAIGISRNCFYQWREKDKKFAEKIYEIYEANIDFAETMLMKNIRDGKETSLIFFLKTKGKERGYVEEERFDHTSNDNSILQSLQIEIIDSRDKVRNE